MSTPTTEEAIGYARNLIPDCWSDEAIKVLLLDAEEWSSLARHYLRRADKAWAELKQVDETAKAMIQISEERAEKAEKLWKEFITLMEITEESDSGNEFNPNKISSCRAMDGKRLNEILNEARQIVFDTPKE